jgi:Spy/CpxP family protein refolding chaperone
MSFYSRGGIMVKKGLYLSIIAVILFSVAGLAGCRRHSPGQKAEFMMDYASETLDLDENQKAHLNQIKDELLAKGLQMRADKAAMHDELVALLRSDAIDPDRLRAMVTEHRVKMEALIDLGIVRLAEFHRTLTPEQREKLVAKLESFKKWHGHDWEE